MKRIFVIIVVTVLGASLVPMEAQDEVLLKIGCQDEPKTLNIWKATDMWTKHAVGWFYPALYYGKPVTLEPLPDVCTISLNELYANSPDGLTFIFPLRDDVLWDDGTPLTAYDFEFAYTIITELEIPDYILIYEDVEYLRTVDDYTLEIKLARCTPQFEETIIYSFAVPTHQFEPMLIKARDTDVPMQTFLDMPVDDPISAGPFSFGQWEKGAFVKLVTNPNYYGKGRTVVVNGETITEGPAYDGLLLKLYSTTDAALLGIQKGEIDYIWWNLDPGYISQLLGSPDITIEKADELGFFYLAPNLAKEPFDDLALRQAMVYMVDKTFIVSRVLQGYGGEAHSVVMPAAGVWYCDDVKKFGDGMSKDERIAMATEILTGAGYTVPEAKYPEGVLKLPDDTDMQPFEILTPPADYDPMRAQCGALIQEWWREIGIPVTAKPTSFGEIVQKTFEAMTFDWYILGWRIGGSGYPDHMRYYFHSDQAVPDGNNPMSYKNPQVDRYLEDLMTLCDRDELVYVSCEAQKLIIEEVGYCPLYYRSLNEAHRNDTFTGWFTQLGGIGCIESPRSCLLYLEPFGEPPPPQQADLRIKKTVSDPTPTAGDTVTFTITVYNDGPDTATNIDVKDVIPTGYTYVAASIAGGDSRDDTGAPTLTWTINRLASGNNTVLTFQAVVQAAGTYKNVAQVTASDQYDPDSTPNNDDGDQSEDDEDYAIAAPSEADLRMTKTVSDPTPTAGDTVTFTIRVYNDGPDTATNIDVEDVIPTGYTYVAARITGGDSRDDTGAPTLTWAINRLASGNNTVLTFQAVVQASGNHKNVAQVTASDQYDPDSTPNNDDGDQSEDDEDYSTTTPQQAAPSKADLRIKKNVSDPTPNVGDTVTFTITVYNDGPDTATNIGVEDVIPNGYSYVAASIAGGDSRDDTGAPTLTWTINSLANGNNTALTFQAVVQAAGNYKNVAQVTASDQNDPDSTPNNDDGDQSEDDEHSSTTTPDDDSDTKFLIGIVIITVITGAAIYRSFIKKGPIIPHTWLTEKQIAGFWVYPYLKTAKNTHDVTIVIVKGLQTEKEEPILGKSVNVALFDEEDNTLPLVRRPEDEPLPEVGGPSISVNADFQFTIAALALKSMAVTIRDDTKIFYVHETTTATTGKAFGAASKPKRIIRWIISIFFKCSVKTSNIPANRSGRQLAGIRLHESFNMDADFHEKGRYRCKNCEYRQYVRGTFTFNGVAAIHQLPDGPLDPTIWREDGVPHHFGQGHHMFYGHRDDPETPTDIYQAPNRSTGHEYRGFDKPIIAHPRSTVTMAMNLEFRGEIVDIYGGKVKRTTTWTVNHSRP